jgi:hypothetical protein
MFTLDKETGNTFINGTLDVSGNSNFSKNLSIGGTLSAGQLQVESSKIVIKNPVLQLGSNDVPDSLDRGISFNYVTDASRQGFFGYEQSSDRFVFIPDASNTTTDIFTGNYGSAYFGKMTVGNTGANGIIQSNGNNDLILQTGNTNTGVITIVDGADQDITLVPNGTGNVVLSADTVVVGDSGATATISSNGAGDLVLNTNSGTDSGSITIVKGVNQNITLLPHGTGKVVLSADKVIVGDSGATATISSNGAGNLILNTNDGTNSGSITIANGANGNITLDPNGSGSVVIAGSLSVQGNIETITSTEVFLGDPVIEIGKGYPTNASDRGIHLYTTDNPFTPFNFFGYDATDSTFMYLTDASVNTIGQYSGTRGTVKADISANTINTNNLAASGTLNVGGATTLNGTVALGNASSDDISLNGYIASNIIPKTNNTYELGSSTNKFGNIYGNVIGTVTGAASQVSLSTKNDNVSYYPTFSAGATGDKALFTDNTATGLTYNPSSNTLTTVNFVGSLTNCSGLPISTGVSGLGTDVATFLATPSSANLRTAVTDETGTGSLVFATSPTLVTPLLGTPASGDLSNCSGLPISTGVSGLGTDVATFLATPSSANLRTAVTDETGTGSLVFATSPTLVTPLLGTPASGDLSNCSGLPISTGVSGLAANVATFLATPSSANLRTAVTDETGTGSLVFATSPTLTTPKIVNDGYIADANGNELIVFGSPSALAINEIKITNAAIDDAPIIAANGGDANINLTLNAKGTGSVVIAKADINGGTIDGTTIATSNITVGSGKTLNVSAGTLTTSALQNQYIIEHAASNVDIGSYDLRASTLTADSLTSGRVIYTGTNGVLSAEAEFAYDTTSNTLAVVNLSAQSISRVSTAVDEDLTITLTGAYDSSILLNSSGTGSDAIGLTTSAGGINLSANVAKGIYLNSTTTFSNYMFPYTVVSPITTVGDTSYHAINILGGLILRSGNSSAINDTFPTALSIYNLIPNCIVGSSFEFRIKNNNTSSGKITFLQGTNNTLIPTAPANTVDAGGHCIIFIAVCTNIATPAFTIYSLGTLAP